MGSKGLIRSRWAAIGAAVAVTLGGGGLIGVSAASGDASSLKTVTPTRIMDTRQGTDGKVSGETVALQVTGEITTYASNGTTPAATVVPAGANAVSLNLTVTEGERNQGYGFVTAFPCTAVTDTVPNASTLNFVEGVDVANSTVVPLGATGKICLNVYGSAHLIIDANGYYETASAGAVDAYTKAESDAKYVTDAYTKAESDAKYVTDAYTKAESDDLAYADYRFQWVSPYDILPGPDNNGDDCPASITQAVLGKGHVTDGNCIRAGLSVTSILVHPNVTSSGGYRNDFVVIGRNPGLYEENSEYVGAWRLEAINLCIREGSTASVDGYSLVRPWTDGDENILETVLQSEGFDTGANEDWGPGCHAITEEASGDFGQTYAADVLLQVRTYAGQDSEAFLSIGDIQFTWVFVPAD